MRRDAVALIGGRIDAHAKAAGGVEVADRARRGPERRGMLGIDPALDGVSVDLDVALPD
jgi:hypothetical protein